MHDLRAYRGFFLAACLVLFLSFSINFFAAMDTDAFLQNFKSSETLVSNEVVCKGHVFNGFMVARKPEGVDDDKVIAVCDTDHVQEYVSHFGLQGRVYAFGYRVLSSIRPVDPAKYIVASRTVNAVISAAVLAVFLLWARSRYGLYVGLVSLLAVACSPMLVGFARNLYWSLPTLLLPLPFMLYAFHTKVRHKQTLAVWIGLFVILYIRYLSGYEYVTTSTIMPLSIIGYYLYLERAKLKDYVRNFLIACAVSIFAFGCAFATHVHALNPITGSTSNSIQRIKQRAEARLIDSDNYLKYPIIGLQVNLPDVYKVANEYVGFSRRVDSGSYIWALLAAGINYALMPVVRLPVSLREPFATFSQSFLVFLVVLFLLYKFGNRSRQKGSKEYRELQALWVFLGISLVGYFSWLIAAHSHSLVHAHVNGVTMYMPLALVGFIIMGNYSKQYVLKAKKLVSK